MEDTITIWLSSYGTVAILVLMAVNGSMSMPPSEVVLSCAGIMAAKGIIPLHYALIAAVLGNWLGASILYFSGRFWGETAIVTTREKLAGLPCGLGLLASVLPSRETIAHYAHQHRTTFPWWILYCRCLPVIRSVVSIPAGISHISYALFSVLTVAGAFIWTILWGALGFLTEKQAAFGKASSYVALLLFGVMFLFLLKAIHKYLSNNRMDHYK